MDKAKIEELANSFGITHNIDVNVLIYFAEMVLKQANVTLTNSEHSKYYYDFDRNK